MLRSLLSNPLLLREMFSGVKGAVPGRATYPGLTVTLCVSLVVWGLYAVCVKAQSAFACGHWFVLAAFLQTWVWLYRSGAYAASAIAGADEEGALAVIATTPNTLEQALFAKMAGALAPLGVEALLIAFLNFVCFFWLGEGSLLLFFGVTSFQLAMIAGGAGVGLLFGRRLGDSAKAVRTYHKLALFVGLTGICMMYGSLVGHVAVVAFALYLLLSLLPALFEKFRIWTGTVALGLIILMPFSLMFDLNSIYTRAKNANPYFVLCRTAPIDLSNEYVLRNVSADELYPFANEFFCYYTGAKKLANDNLWMGRFIALIDYNPQVAAIVNREYLCWRVRKLSVFTWVGLVLFGVSILGVEYSVKRRLSSY